LRANRTPTPFPLLAGMYVRLVLPNPDITDATNSKIYTPPIEVAQSTEGWSALRKLQVAAQYLGLRGVDATILRYEVR
jgi:hypothetical protein